LIPTMPELRLLPLIERFATMLAELPLFADTFGAIWKWGESWGMGRVLPLRDLAAKTALGMANQHPGSDSRSREWLVAAAAKIYEVHAKKSFKSFKNRMRFIGNLLEAAGVNAGNGEAIRKIIRKYDNGKLLPAQELEDICRRVG
jgi:hypothetical protein